MMGPSTSLPAFGIFRSATCRSEPSMSGASARTWMASGDRPTASTPCSSTTSDRGGHFWTPWFECGVDELPATRPRFCAELLCKVYTPSVHRNGPAVHRIARGHLSKAPLSLIKRQQPGHQEDADDQDDQGERHADARQVAKGIVARRDHQRVHVWSLR